MIVRGVRASLPSAALAGLVLAVTGCDGKGELNCPAGQTACSGVCVDAASARDNCLCGFQCPTGAACSGRVCSSRDSRDDGHLGVQNHALSGGR